MAAEQLEWKDSPFKKPFSKSEETSRLHKWLALASALTFLALTSLLVYQLLQIYAK